MIYWFRWPCSFNEKENKLISCVWLLDFVSDIEIKKVILFFLIVILKFLNLLFVCNDEYRCIHFIFRKFEMHHCSVKMNLVKKIMNSLIIPNRIYFILQDFTKPIYWSLANSPIIFPLIFERLNWCFSQNLKWFNLIQFDSNLFNLILWLLNLYISRYLLWSF
jgi:hypothetical protein